jgi:hypothetical protein
VYTLVATSTAAAGSSVSVTLTVTPGAASVLAFTAPAGVTSYAAATGAVIAPPLTVAIRDAFGNKVPSATNTVSVALTAPNGATLGGTTSVAAVNGVATFSNLSIDLAHIGYTLTATSATLGSATSLPINILGAGDAQLAFGTMANGVAGDAIGPAITVEVQDAQGQKITSSTAPVTLVIASGPGGASISGTTTVTALSGVASFGDIVFTKAGSYSLTATTTASNTAPATSATFTVVAGAPEKISIVAGDEQTAPVNTATPVPPQVLVTDDFDNPVAGAEVRLTIMSGGGSFTVMPGGDNATSGPANTDANGVLTLAAWTLGPNAGENILRARLDDADVEVSFIAHATSGGGSAGPATQLAFTTQPTDAISGVAIPIVVALRDQSGNPATGTNAVTLALASNPAGGSLSGTTTVNAVDGIATFSNVSIRKAGTGYTLTASATDLTSATSNAFDIAVGAATAIGKALPAHGVADNGDNQTGDAGTTLPKPFIVHVTDGFNSVPGATVTWTPGNGTLAAVTTTTDANGLTSNTMTLGGTLGTQAASAEARLGGNSVTFHANVTGSPGVPTQLAVTSQPGNTTTGATLSPVTIVVRDQFGNAVSGAVSVTIALTTPGTATLGGTTTRTTSGGTVTFNDLTVDKPNIYSLTATSTGLASAVTNSFVITGPATKLAISAGDNVSGVAGQATTPPPKVLVTDDGGNPVAGAQVTFSVVSGGGTITPANGIVTSDANGVAALTEWKLGAAAGDQTVQAALSTGTPVVFTAHAASGTAAAIEAVSGTGQTAAVGAALTAFVVKVTDANGLAVEGATVDWTATNGTIAATSHTAADGTSSLAMTLGQTPGPASATASISGVGSVTFNATATVGPPAKLELTSQPTNTTSATVITPAVVVAVRDQFGNATTATSSVTVAIASNPSGGVLSGTTTVAAVNGIAMFSDLSIDKAGMGYTLVLSATGLTSVTTTAFNITAGAPAHLAIASGDNTTGIVGGATADQASVTVTDASDNLVSGATVTFVASGDGSTTPANGQVTTGANGVATLPTWTLGTTAGAQTLTATVNALSVTFHATASSAAANGITTVSGGGQTGTVGTAVASPLIVHVTDNGGNSVAGARVVWTATNGSVTSPSFTDATGNASTTLTLGGTAGTNATSVTATIDNGQNVSFTASATAGAPHHLAIAQQPTQTAAATAISPSVTVTLRDSFNNITTGTNAVTVALGANPGGGTLSGTLTRNVSGNTATFDDLSIQKAGVGYTLVATSPGLASATTDAFTIVAGAAANIAIVQGDNGGGQVGMASSPTPQVRVTDANGNNVEGATVTYTVLSGGGSTTPPNGAVTSDANGLATLGSWILGPTIGTNTLEARLDATHAVTFTATGSSLAVATIAIVSGNNQSAVVNQAFSPFVVHVEDANGNPVEGARVDWTLTGSGALSANPSTTDATGNASTTLTLGATAGPVSATAKVSNGQQVTFTGTAQPSSAAVVAFTSQPSNTVAGATMAPVVVAVRDFFGNTVTTSSAAVTLTIGTNPGSGTLGGTVTRNAVNGVATFSDLSINRVGTGYTLSAASTGLTSATSDAFAITVGAPAQIDILAGNGLAAVVNENTATPPKVKVSDANGNVVPNASVNFVVTGGGGTIILTADGARVTSGTVTTDASGIATIDSWTMGSAIGTNTLEARVSSLTASFSAVASSAAPNAIAIVSGNDNQSGTVATALAIPFAVKVTDALGNPVDGAAVTWTATNGTIAASTTTTSDGTTSARLTLGTAAGASSATATIANGQNVRFDATALAGPAASLTFTSQPSNTTAEVTLPAITVALHDVYGNATPGTNTVTLALGTNPTGETLNGTVSVAAVNGVATFNNVQVSGAGAGFTLLASATGLTSATSHAFNVASNIVSTVTATNGDGQSGTVNTAAGNALVVSVKDASNSAIQAASISWTARHGTVLSASETFTDTNGETSITIDYSTVAGTDTITATSINGKSASFVVTALPGAPVKLAFVVPSGAANYSGTPSAPIVVPTTLQVAVQDVFGNTVTTSTAPISLSLNGGVGAQLLNAPTTNATAGVANFDQAKIDKVGNYTVTATSSGLTSATSITINISFGAVGGVEFITKTGTGTAGVAVTPAIQVKVTDSDGNLVLAPVPVTLSISFRSQGSGTMTGTLTVNSSNGIATFSDIAFTEAATYRMKADASASGFSFITSGNFVISP